MSRALLRSVLELRHPVVRLPSTSVLSIRARCFNQTPQIVESSPPDSATTGGELKAAASQSPLSPTTSVPSPPIPSAPHPTPQTPTPTGKPSDLDPSIRDLLPHLVAQPGHYVTIHVHGRPYLVTAGDQLRLPFRMPGAVAGDVLRLNRASILGSRDFTLKGEPYVDERLFECRAVVLGTETEPMRVMIKKKQRNRRKKHVRSKHKYTVLRISELRINDLAEMEH